MPAWSAARGWSFAATRTNASSPHARTGSGGPSSPRSGKLDGLRGGDDWTRLEDDGGDG